MEQRGKPAAPASSRGTPAIPAGYVNRCAGCVVCGGASAPGSDRLCGACRGLAAIFARAAAQGLQS